MSNDTTETSYNAHDAIPLQPVHGWDDLRRLSNDSGGHFFSADTMRFFGSRLLGSPRFVKGTEDRLSAQYVGVTSEDNWDRTEREYRARVFDVTSHTAVRDDGRTIDIVTFNSDTIGDETHTSARQAHAAADRYLKNAQAQPIG